MGKLYRNKRKPKREGKKITVGKIGDVPAGRGATVKLKDGNEIALFNVNGEFYAVENFCPHRAYPLADSRLYGNTVECDSHGWRFDVRSGECLTQKDCSIEPYEVVIEDGIIKILV
jgi:nitrite reductase (NADH) small subunit/3-phenylpropionate/trans-cinnamate dioxygenase ferredoxin subunit